MRRHAKGLTPTRIGIYVFLLISATFFLLPLYVMMVTSLKGMPEIRQGNLLALPGAPTIAAWTKAWSSACTGPSCDGIQVGFLNSVKILLPSVTMSISVGAVTGYALSLWRPRGAAFLFGMLMAVAFVPYQVFLFPMVRMFSFFGLNSSLPGIIVVHTVFGLPTMTLIFRNYFAGIPLELIKAAPSTVPGSGASSAPSCCRWRCPSSWWPSFCR